LKSKKTQANSDAFSKIRADAETLLRSSNVKDVSHEGREINNLFQQLQIQQVELEMQNDELRIANEELEIQQMKFAGIYDLAPVGYFITDANGVITDVNNAGLRLVDAGKSSIKNKHLQKFIDRDYIDTYYLFYRKLLTTGNKQTCQVKFSLQTGREFYAQLEGIAINMITDTSVQCYVAVVDITERMEAEQKLAETKDRLELSLKASQAGTWELNLDNMQFHLDKANYHLCNINERSFDGRYQSFIGAIYADDREAADQHFRTAISNGKEIDIVCRFLSAQNKVCFISIRGHMITKANQNKGFVGIMIDFTEKFKSEEEAAQLKIIHQKNVTTATLYAEENERKRISEALHDSVSQLLYGIKIQLTQLNSPVSSSADAVAKINELLQMAIQETRNISFELAPSILTDFGLPATIDELAKRLSSPMLIIKASVKGFSQRMDLLLEICIFRIVQELVNNCMKHSGASTIAIELKKNRKIDIMVKDNGRGFEVKEAEKKVPKGAGLQSIYNRLTLYNGDININSEKGKGTTVNITLNI
jgi:PAS domain S-box-containing protein